MLVVETRSFCARLYFEFTAYLKGNLSSNDRKFPICENMTSKTPLTCSNLYIQQEFDEK